MQSRRYQEEVAPLKDRLAQWVEQVRKQAEELPPGPEQEAMLKKARQADMAANLDEWANSPGLKPPK